MGFIIDQRWTLNILLCIIVEIAEVYSKPELGSSCVTPGGKKGVCVFQTECTKRGAPTELYFETCALHVDGSPIICCALKNATTANYEKNTLRTGDDAAAVAYSSEQQTYSSTDEPPAVNEAEYNTSDNAIETRFFAGNRNKQNFWDSLTSSSFFGNKPRSAQTTKNYNQLTSYNSLDSDESYYRKPANADADVHYQVSGNNNGYNPNYYNSGTGSAKNVNGIDRSAQQWNYQQQPSSAFFASPPRPISSEQQWDYRQKQDKVWPTGSAGSQQQWSSNRNPTAATTNWNGANQPSTSWNYNGGFSPDRNKNYDYNGATNQASIYNNGYSGQTANNNNHFYNSNPTRETNQQGQSSSGFYNVNGGSGQFAGNRIQPVVIAGMDNVRGDSSRTRGQNKTRNNQSKIRNGVAVSNDDDYEEESVYFPGDPVVDTSKVPRESGNKRISEIKCEEYAKLVTSTISAVSLSLDSKTKSLNVNDCSDAVTLIVGGTKAALGEFPHMAALGYRTSRDITYNCGGTLISDQYVLTAAHCTQSTLGNPVQVRLGDLNLVRSDDGAQPIDITIAEVIIHRDYKTSMLYNDIALLRLDRKVKFTKNLRPACLSSKQINSGEKVIATGWGTTNYGDLPSDDLLKVTFDVMDNRRCEQMYGPDNKLPSGIVKTMMCAADLSGGKDTCQGDSGGPLEITGTGARCLHQVVGLTSFGRVCGLPDSPGIYTRISEYLPWIEGIVWRNN